MIRRTTVIVLPLALVCALAVVFLRTGDDDSPPLVRLPLPALDPAHAENFSGQNAYQHVARIVAFGPRPPASEGYEKTLQYLESTLAECGWKTRRQSFTAATPDGPTRFTNLIARHQRAPAPRDPLPIVLGGHLDSKKLPFPFVGANDGGSSTGVMLEIARVLAKHPQDAAAIELVFFDGEEAFREGISSADGLYGSKYYAHQLIAQPEQPAFSIVIDLIGDAKVPLFYNTDAPSYTIAALKKIQSDRPFKNGLHPAPGPYLDDHVPLQNIGLPCLHLIGNFKAMPYWHQPGDTLDKIDPDMLEKVGQLVLQTLAIQRAPKPTADE